MLRCVAFKIAVASVVLLTLAGCGGDAVTRSDGSILAIGDSVMAWNRTSGRSIPDVIEARAGKTVVDRSVPGARFSHPNAVARATGFDTRAQYVRGGWSWVVMDGGANDLRSECGCRACENDLNTLIDADGVTGEIPAFVRSIRADGARVLIMGYYGPNGQGGAFDGCSDELAELDARNARMARRLDGVFFADSSDVIDQTNLSLYAADNVHPSPRGSAAIGSYLANVIVTNGDGP